MFICARESIKLRVLYADITYTSLFAVNFMLYMYLLMRDNSVAVHDISAVLVNYGLHKLGNFVFRFPANGIYGMLP